jgi:hypothetical protein
VWGCWCLLCIREVVCNTPPPPPSLTIDNSKNKWCMNSRDGRCRHGESDVAIPPGTYSAGQVLLDSTDPTKVIARTDESFLKPIMNYEITGQVANVVFLEGLVFHQGNVNSGGLFVVVWLSYLLFVFDHLLKVKCCSITVLLTAK